MFTVSNVAKQSLMVNEPKGAVDRSGLSINADKGSRCLLRIDTISR